MQWVEHLYNTTRSNAAKVDVVLPQFEEFWNGEQLPLQDQLMDNVYTLEAFREDPNKNALATPSGKIEIFSKTIAGYGYDDCIGHPAWFEKSEWLGGKRAATYPLHLMSNQPKTRLHSQFDHGSTSRKAKIKQREVIRMNSGDARARGIGSEDIVRVFNDRGSCLAAAVISDSLRESVVELPTGAWYDPENSDDENSMDVHGNPNVLTRDVGTSKLAQGPTAHSCLVEVERFDGELPEITVFSQPKSSTPEK
jgi:biotin/methionine sulfoxide reductase